MDKLEDGKDVEIVSGQEFGGVVGWCSVCEVGWGLVCEVGWGLVFSV